MLLSISTTHTPATDLGFLLHKNPLRVRSVNLTFGRAHVFYTEASAERCTACLLLEVDAVGLVRREGGLEHYVNDRPYVASSFLSVAIADLFGTALNGRSKERPELADQPIPLSVRIPVLPCRGGDELLRRVFEPLGYRVGAERRGLDERYPEWGDSHYWAVELENTCRLRTLLAHLYVLLPVFDVDKHYYIGQAEVDKLLRHGEGWLAEHPEREQIARRYLLFRPSLTRQALERLAEDGGDADAAAEQHAQEEQAIERPIRLNDVRMDLVVEALAERGCQRVLDLGCGEGRLIGRLMRRAQFKRIVGLDASHRSLEIAARRLRLDTMSDRQRQRVELFHGALTYRDRRLEGFDAAAAVEVVEHLDPPRLQAFERVLFQCARPGSVIMTTPNREYNAKFESLPAGKFRHRDHRFEWTRAEFEEWASGVATRNDYTVEFRTVGDVDPELGSPTQMGVFRR